MALAAFPNVLSSVPGNNMMTHSHLFGDLVPSAGLQGNMQACIHNE